MHSTTQDKMTIFDFAKENGLKTLVLERGRMVKHIEDYPTAHLDPWDLPNGDQASRETIERMPKQHRTGYVTRESRKHFFVDDIKHPYNEDRRFDWIRGYHVGGRSLMWGRQSYRLSDIDFEANKKDGIAVDWPVRYKDIEPWYEKVEEFMQKNEKTINSVKDRLKGLLSN